MKTYALLILIIFAACGERREASEQKQLKPVASQPFENPGNAYDRCMHRRSIQTWNVIEEEQCLRELCIERGGVPNVAWGGDTCAFPPSPAAVPEGVVAE